MAILCASTSLMLRTYVFFQTSINYQRASDSLDRIALWDRKKVIVALLVILCLGHWVLLYRTMFVVKARWDEKFRACVVEETESSLLKVTFLFSKPKDRLRFIRTLNHNLP